jgi:hypothetical protein
VGDGDDLVAEAERKQHLGRAWDEGGDAHLHVQSTCGDLNLRYLAAINRKLSLALLGILLLAAGCGDSNEKSTPATTASTPTTTAPAVKQAVPGSLEETESAAEDIIDYANAGKRAKVAATARDLVEVTKGEAATTLKKAGVPADRIAVLQDRARSVEDQTKNGDPLKISLAANQVSALMPEFYARYSDPVPPDVLELDYLDREAQLRSRAGDEAKVKTAVAGLAATWSMLQSSVIKAGGGKAARDFTRHVAAMRRLAQGSDASAIQKEAGNGLELVDVLEGVYRK